MKKKVESLFAACVVDLFKAHKVVLRRISAPLRLDQRDVSLSAGVLDVRTGRSGLGSAYATGKLVLVSAFDLIAKTRPADRRAPRLSATSAADWIYIRDWTRELANQLAGRLANALSASGADLSHGVPRAFAADVGVRELLAIGEVQVHFASDIHLVHAAVTLATLVTSLANATPPGTRVAEGTVTMFDEE